MNQVPNLRLFFPGIRRLRESRHHRQPSASKILRPTPHLSTKVPGLPFAAKLANPLRRILSSGQRQRSHSPPQFRGVSGVPNSSASHFLGEAQRRDTEAADLTNIRVPSRVSEAVIGSNEAALPLLTRQASTSGFPHPCSSGG